MSHHQIGLGLRHQALVGHVAATPQRFHSPTTPRIPRLHLGVPQRADFQPGATEPARRSSTVRAVASQAFLRSPARDRVRVSQLAPREPPPLVSPRSGWEERSSVQLLRKVGLRGIRQTVALTPNQARAADPMLGAFRQGRDPRVPVLGHWSLGPSEQLVRPIAASLLKLLALD